MAVTTSHQTTKTGFAGIKLNVGGSVTFKKSTKRCELADIFSN